MTRPVLGAPLAPGRSPPPTGPKRKQLRRKFSPRVLRKKRERKTQRHSRGLEQTGNTIFATQKVKKSLEVMDEGLR